METGARKEQPEFKRKIRGAVFVIGSNLVCNTLEELQDGKQKEVWRVINCNTGEEFIIEHITENNKFMEKTIFFLNEDCDREADVDAIDELLLQMEEVK